MDRTNTITEQKSQGWNRVGYAAFTLAGLLFALFGEDKTQGPLFLALALVFDPYDQAVKWRDRPLGVRVWLVVHMIITLASFCWMFFNE